RRALARRAATEEKPARSRQGFIGRTMRGWAEAWPETIFQSRGVCGVAKVLLGRLTLLWMVGMSQITSPALGCSNQIVRGRNVSRFRMIRAFRKSALSTSRLGITST